MTVECDYSNRTPLELLTARAMIQVGKYGHLLLSQVQAVYYKIGQWRLEQRDFEWQFQGGEAIGSLAYEIPMLVLRPSPTYYFGFALDVDARHQIGYCPGYDVPLNLFASLDWTGALQHVDLWLENLTRELHADDPWALLAGERRVLSPPVGSIEDNSPFEPIEQQRIIELLNQRLAEILRAQRLTAEQVDYLTLQVEYLVTAVARLGRRDWWAVASSILFQIGLAAMFAPDSRQYIFNALTQAVHAGLIATRLLGP